MGRTYDILDDAMREWIDQQHVFFVASAPTDTDGHVNLSPKGYDSFRVLDDTTVAYLDLTFMFCAFEGPPRIVRLFGRGEVLRPGDADFDALIGRFPAVPGVRSVIRCRLDRIQSSCGYSVPFMVFESDRETLAEWAERRGPEGIEAYHAEKNQVSIDGLTGLRIEDPSAELA